MGFLKVIIITEKSKNNLLAKGVLKHYKNGKMHGLHERYYYDGQLEEQKNYTNGKLHGLHEEWDINGQLRKKENYKNGKLHGLHQT
jgi:antitoxin component YwqK of YwqJK toxin-antitoxin module